MASGATSEDGEIGFQIAPMVDVVFVLLLFFMAVAGSQVSSKELTSHLPSTPKGGSQNVTPYIIEISPQGIVSSGGEMFDSASNHDLPTLKARLESNMAKFGDRDPVIIRPDPQATHQRVIDVLNAAAAAGVKSLSFS